MKTFRTSAVSAAVALALTLAGCGSADTTAAVADGELEKTEVSVGVLPLADYASVYWAKEKGFFEKQGLDVTLDPLQGGPVGVQKIVSGELDFSFSNSVSGTIAQAKGAPISTVVHASSLGPNSMGVFVKPGSDITDLQDLDGRTVGVNTTNNIGDTAFANLAASKGADVSPQWIEVPFPEMVAGVKAGSIDAGYVPEPFKSAAEEAGLRSVADLSGGPNAELPAATFIASDPFVAENPDTVRAFVDAMYAANADMKKDEDEFRSWLPGVAGVDQKTAETMSIPVFAERTDVTRMQGVADMLAEQGLVPADFKASEHTYVPEG